MIKTQIQLEEWQYEALKKVSQRTSRSMSDFIREGVSLLLKKGSKQTHAPLEDLAGKYHPIPSGDLKAHDRDWADSIR
jgi:Arc/MetJ-type ribon-helix-helix transcriptional regulator